ncbi:MAG: dihydroorotase [Desulfobacula sp.]|jgi:dihydroorotase|uniref:dihydroorotase n=1 Tax=Desulfobacula sp. TaxID=2593537 RepID=UPI001DC29C2E|nr:dihydroorotase [Desulfobacula sp.]MBT3485877.1 dihydroorotase [Desulfobacula sp.]MBT3805480.1 dihydroorotase [Desulfobacula sp.]MBT4026805.1 dihydroorotase [Desulfobacula sp.]MBT4199591.1 dihydroorotase [Desulfobacula sp.]
MQTLIKGAHLLDPGNIDGKKGIFIKDHLIEAIVDPDDIETKTYIETRSDTKIIDAKGMIVVPGLIDIHVHLREPGQEYKETIKSGLLASARGGFTGVCSMPNTNPVNDNRQVTKFIINRSKELGLSKVYPTGAITRGSLGNTLAEIYDMQKAGIVAVTDDGKPIENANMMRRAMEYCKGLNIPVFVHAEELSLVDGGSMNEGPFATFWGIKGIPNAAESIMVARDIALCELTGASVHFCHVSTKESVEAIRQAKKRKINITCETAPHYFTLTDADVKDYDTNFKMNPPLRSEEDRLAIICGLSDGTIDLIASDHAPHSVVEKDVEFDMAAFGIIGLETSLPLSLKLFHDKFLTLEELINKMSKNPAKIIGINNDIKPGNLADLTIIDPDVAYEINPESFKSKSKNSPFSGMKVKGRVFLTMVNGKVVYLNGK